MPRRDDHAIETFEVAIARAAYLLRLYEQMVNLRSYRIRSDWAESFCRIMHWPIASEIDRVDSHSAIVVLKDGAELASTDFDKEQMKDLLRASLVMAVSAMDAYFHAKICANVVAVARQGIESMPPSLAGHKFEAVDFLRGKDAKRPMAMFRSAFARTMSYQSLQNKDTICKYVSRIGVKKFWSKTASRMKCDSDGLDRKLSQIVNRRHKIVHEGDLTTGTKNRNSDRDLEPATVRKSIEFIENFVSHSEDEINGQLGT